MDPESVPVVCIDQSNANQTWPSLKLAISTASFIAIDTELSGLGDRKAFISCGVDDRYTSARSVAASRAILSLGISCFKLIKDDSSKWRYIVQTYNILTLCQEEYIVEPESLKFLMQHGFDFNKQYSVGLRYSRGHDKSKPSENNWDVRQLFSYLILQNKPLVVHNGLLDMIFMYHNFYADTPKNLGTFVSDIEDMFTAGIYDTKYLAEYHVRTTASYLEYLYRKCDYENRCASTGTKVIIEFLTYSNPPSYIEYRICRPTRHSNEDEPICKNFASFGWCSQMETCTKSHDVDLIIRKELSKKKCRKRNKKPNGTPVPEPKESTVNEEEIKETQTAANKKKKKKKKKHDDKEEVAAVKCENKINEPDCNGHAEISTNGSKKKKKKKKDPIIENGRSDDAITEVNLKVKKKRKKRYEEHDATEVICPPEDLSCNGQMDNAPIKKKKKKKKKRNDGMLSEEPAMKRPKCHDDAEASSIPNQVGVDCDNRQMEMPSCKPKKKKKKKKDSSTDVDEVKVGINSIVEADVENERTTGNGGSETEKCGHRAGFDAFMTGFAFACYVSKLGNYPKFTDNVLDFQSLNVEDFSNKLYLQAKQFPLNIVKSSYSRNSTEHLRKISTLRSSS